MQIFRIFTALCWAANFFAFVNLACHFFSAYLFADFRDMPFDAFYFKLIAITSTIDHDNVLTVMGSVMADLFTGVPTVHNFIANIFTCEFRLFARFAVFAIWRKCFH